MSCGSTWAEERTSVTSEEEMPKRIMCFILSEEMGEGDTGTGEQCHFKVRKHQQQHIKVQGTIRKTASTNDDSLASYVELIAFWAVAQAAQQLAVVESSLRHKGTQLMEVITTACGLLHCETKSNQIKCVCLINSMKLVSEFTLGFQMRKPYRFLTF